MPITDQSATRKPPLYHVHEYATGDAVEDLNAWAISLFSPKYSDAAPFVASDSTGAIQIIENHVALLDGYWIVFDGQGNPQVLSPIAFTAQFALEA